MTIHESSAFFSGDIINTEAGVGVATIANVPCGTGADRVLVFEFNRRTDRMPSITSITIGGEAVTVLGSDFALPTTTNRASRIAARFGPTVTGNQTLVITCAASDTGDSDILGQIWVGSGTDVGQASPTVITNSGTDGDGASVSTLNIPSATGRLVVPFHRVLTGGSVGDGTPSGFTERPTSSNFGGGYGFITGDAAGDTTVSTSVTWDDNAASEWWAMGISLLAPSSQSPINSLLIGRSSPYIR